MVADRDELIERQGACHGEPGVDRVTQRQAESFDGNPSGHAMPDNSRASNGPRWVCDMEWFSRVKPCRKRAPPQARRSLVAEEVTSPKSRSVRTAARKKLSRLPFVERLLLRDWLRYRANPVEGTGEITSVESPFAETGRAGGRHSERFMGEAGGQRDSWRHGGMMPKCAAGPSR